MDYTCVDVTHVGGAAVGDVVTLLGSDPSAPGGNAPDEGQAEAIGIAELARHAETIPYEILCAMGTRVRKRYVQSD